MCGICGFYTKKAVTQEQFKAMNDSMAHRGPDDAGEVLLAGKNGYAVGLGHRRLSVIDLSDAGHQPMFSNDKNLSVVFNGEIYNHQKLRKELAGYKFRTHCDTEVILAAYLKWKSDFVNHLEGMFAAAVYDRDTGELYLIRDRIGKKPLYYWIDENNIVFASELKPIFLFPGFSKEIRRDIVSRYLLKGYINAPDTILKNVYKLEPGCLLKFCNGRRNIRKYWDISKTYHQNVSRLVKDYGTAKNELKRLLKKAVKNRMEADVPLGVLLSGGIDSSLIAAMAQENMVSGKILTFTVGFWEKEYNEAGFAGAVADYLGTKHTELYIEEKDVQNLVNSIPQFYDEPFGDSSAIPTMLVSRLAKKDVTVALGGDGGDEVFCGYCTYDFVRKMQWLDWAGAAAHCIGKIGSLEQHYPPELYAVSQNRNPKTKTQLVSTNYIEAAIRFAADAGGQVPVKYESEDRYGVSDWQIRRMLLDMDTYLPGDILTKIDRASMKYSLECRCPLLDTDVIEYSFRIPHQYKYRRGEKKKILKDIAYEYIPKKILDRPKKGFSVPVDKWLTSFLKEKMEHYIDMRFLQEQGIFEPEFTHRFFAKYLSEGNQGRGRNFSDMAWNYFVFQQWYEYYRNC